MNYVNHPNLKEQRSLLTFNTAPTKGRKISNSKSISSKKLEQKSHFPGLVAATLDLKNKAWDSIVDLFNDTYTLRIKLEFFQHFISIGAHK